MRAVYESAHPYLQVGYWDVNATAPVYCEERVTKKGYIVEPHKVGTMVKLPESEKERNRSYLFREGDLHNQITLTDPREILNMRGFIKCRDHIKEIYCSGDPVEEIKKLEDVEEDLSEEFEEDFEEQEYPSYSEWDEQMATRLEM